MTLMHREVRQSDASLLLATVDLGATDAAYLEAIAQVLTGTKGTPFYKGASTPMPATGNLYTVAASKIFYVFAVTMVVTNPQAGYTYALATRDASDTGIGDLARLVGSGATETVPVSVTFNNPIPLAASYDIYYTSSGSGYIAATCQGYLLDA